MKTTPHSIVLPVGLLVLLAVSVPGCAQVYTLKVDPASRSLTPRNLTYFISAAVLPEKLTPEPLLTAKLPPAEPAADKFVRGALSAIGMIEAAVPDHAELDVNYGYDIQRHERVFTSEVPERRTVSNGSYPETIGGGGSPDVPTAQTIRTKLPDSTLETGWAHKESHVAVYYEKQFHIHAAEKKASIAGTAPRVWDIIVTYEDQDPSLVRAMPLLASAGCNRIGADPSGPVTIRLRSSDVAVAFTDDAR